MAHQERNEKAITVATIGSGILLADGIMLIYEAVFSSLTPEIQAINAGIALVGIALIGVGIAAK
jgi:hypothetical protein